MHQEAYELIMEKRLTRPQIKRQLQFHVIQVPLQFETSDDNKCLNRILNVSRLHFKSYEIIMYSYKAYNCRCA